jgi:hypothetical protein
MWGGEWEACGPRAWVLKEMRWDTLSYSLFSLSALLSRRQHQKTISADGRTPFRNWQFLKNKKCSRKSTNILFRFETLGNPILLFWSPTIKEGASLVFYSHVDSTPTVSLSFQLCMSTVNYIICKWWEKSKLIHQPGPP